MSGFAFYASLAVCAVIFWVAYMWRRVQANVKKLGNSFNIQKIYKNTSPNVAFDNENKEIAFIYASKIIRMKATEVLRWQHTWVERSRGSSLSTHQHIVKVSTRNLDLPLIEVGCPSRAVGENLNATFGAVING